ncbi:Peptidase family M23 [Geodermatophilus saharensis]|uniref:Peptidase family M23 n=1 Tax=Geodermatophilus saharensis TaxID=1137994 RepID=A0A239FIU1_9ACTN|nr:Peptidase family M23 [Geodermatophilus saharensis]
MPGPRTGAHRRAAARPVSPLRGFPPVRPADPAPWAAVLPAPRTADHDVVADPGPAALPTALLAVEEDAVPVDAVPVDAVPVDAVPVDAVPVDAVPAPVAADPAPVHRRRGLRDRRPSLLVAALVAGAVGAAVVGVPGSPQAAAEPTPVLGAMDLATGDEAVEVMPMASITEAEAQARLEEVAASRAERAAAEAAAAEAAAAAAEAARPKAVLPVDGARFTSGFGSRWGTFHYGIDLAAPIGTPEYAAADGVVVRAGAASGFGLAVYVLHENGDVTVYGHMEEILVEPGQYVEAGETIALLGNRGQSTGPHLHFEVHEGGMDGERIDPVGWLAERGVEV